MTKTRSSQELAALRAEFWALPEDALVDRATVAAAFYKSVATMEALAIKGGGPKYTRIGRRALSTKREALDWAATIGHPVENTAQLRDPAAGAAVGLRPMTGPDATYGPGGGK